MNPVDIIKEAIIRVPAVSYALAIAGIAAAASIVIQFVGNDRAAIIIISGVFIAMVLMFIFAKMVVSPDPRTTLPGLILLYSVIMFFTIFLAFTVTAFAAYWPPAWADFLGIKTPPCIGCFIPNNEKVSSFKITVSVGTNPPAGREWEKVAPDRWREKSSEGDLTYFNVKERGEVGDCTGFVVVSQTSPSHKAFIPNKGCPGMPFYINDNDQGWGKASNMTEVR